MVEAAAGALIYDLDAAFSSRSCERVVVSYHGGDGVPSRSRDGDASAAVSGVIPIRVRKSSPINAAG